MGDLTCTVGEFFLHKGLECCGYVKTHDLELVACFQFNTRHGSAYNGALLNRMSTPL